MTTTMMIMSMHDHDHTAADAGADAAADDDDDDDDDNDDDDDDDDDDGDNTLYLRRVERADGCPGARRHVGRQLQLPHVVRCRARVRQRRVPACVCVRARVRACACVCARALARMRIMGQSVPAEKEDRVALDAKEAADAGFWHPICRVRHDLCGRHQLHPEPLTEHTLASLGVGLPAMTTTRQPYMCVAPICELLYIQ